MKIALSTMIVALLLIPALAWAQQPPKPCFSIVVDLQMRQAKDAGTNETHHVEIAYRPGMIGDKGGIYTSLTPTDCNLAAMRPGEIRRFAMYSIHGTATGRQGSVAVNARIDDPGRDSGYIRAELTRKASGATLSFKIRAVPPGNAEEYIGVCAAQAWQPSPPQFDLTNDELAHVSTVHKTLSLRMPNGENGCTGTGTALLNGH
jgi:hypothetical protein